MHKVTDTVNSFHTHSSQPPAAENFPASPNKYNWIYITNAKSHSKTILDQSKTKKKNTWVNSKHIVSMSNVQLLLPFCLQHNAFSWVDPFSVSCFPQQISHSSGISNTLGSWRQLQLNILLFQCLGCTHKLLGSSEGLGSLLQLFLPSLEC